MQGTFTKYTIAFTCMLIISGCVTKPETSTTANTSGNTSNQGKGSYLNKHRTNQACIDLIKEFEGVRLQAYLGPGGHWLIGYGHKAGVFEGMTISATRAEKILKKDLLKFEKNVNRLVKVKLNQNEFGALVCLSYNIGSGNFARSTLLRKLNEGDFTEAANQFAVWRMVNGEVSSHQVKRRARERAIFVD